jgi:1,2-diacylglycerol 3-beta-galactosyltransferase
MPFADNATRRILLLTADTGMGHRRTARALDVAFRQLYGDRCDCTILNPADYGLLARPVRASQRRYDHDARQGRALYGLTFAIGRSPLVSSLVAQGMTWALRGALRQVLRAAQPHAVISTFNLYLAPLAAVLARRAAPPFFVTVTDLADVQPLWFHPRAAVTFVSSEEMRADALAHGLDACRVHVSGIPVDVGHQDAELSKPTLKAALGWDPGRPAILAVGSPRACGMAERIRCLDNLSQPVQLVVVGGGDRALYEHLSGLPWHHPVRFYDWVDDLPRLMRAADVLVTKAGGLIVTEGLACGLPILLVDAIPGQETGNVAFVSQHKAGILAQDPVRILTVLETWLADDGAELARVAHHARLLGRPDAARRVAEQVWQALGAA